MSAKIYQFPGRAHFVPALGQVVPSERRQDSAVVDFLPPRAKVLSSSAWYHEHAVDADRTDH